MADDADPTRLSLKRETVQRVICPRCGAGPSEQCRRVNGRPRVSNHMDRVRKAQQFIRSLLDKGPAE